MLIDRWMFEIFLLSCCKNNLHNVALVTVIQKLFDPQALISLQTWSTSLTRVTCVVGQTKLDFSVGTQCPVSNLQIYLDPLCHNKVCIQISISMQCHQISLQNIAKPILRFICPTEQLQTWLLLLETPALPEGWGMDTFQHCLMTEAWTTFSLWHLRVQLQADDPSLEWIQF